MSQVSAASLLQRRTYEDFVNLGLEIATALGLPVTSWRAGDPTRSLYQYQARVLDTLEGVGHLLARSAFLSSAATEWLHLIAWEVYGVEVVQARPSTPTVTFDNTQSGLHVIGVGELRVKTTDTQQTFVNTEAVTIQPLQAGVVVEFVAEQPGAASSVAEGQIDEIVTTYSGLEIVASSESRGTDTQSNESIIAQCRASLSAQSAYGPKDIYEYVARNPELTGTTEVNRAATEQDDDTGTVTVYVAGADGEVSAPARNEVLLALMRIASPLTVTVVVEQSELVPINIVATGVGVPEGASESFEEYYGGVLAERLHGSLISVSTIYAELHKLFPTVETFELTSPADDVQLAVNEVPVIGTVEITEAT